MRLKQILSISSTTTPALVTAALNVDATFGTSGYGWGGISHPLIRIQAVRASGAAMTAVVFQVQGASDPTALAWSIVPVRLVSAATSLTTVAATQSLSVADASTAEDFLYSPDLEGIPYIRVLAQAVTANAAAGCSAGAWVRTLAGRPGTVSP